MLERRSAAPRDDPQREATVVAVRVAIGRRSVGRSLGEREGGGVFFRWVEGEWAGCCR